jgi:hypothetical protein
MIFCRPPITSLPVEGETGRSSLPSLTRDSPHMARSDTTQEYWTSAVSGVKQFTSSAFSPSRLSYQSDLMC